MKTVAQRCTEWELRVMPTGANPTQRREMRRAFYSGFYAALIAGLDIADESGENNDIGVTMMQRVHDECSAFGAEIRAGRA